MTINTTNKEMLAIERRLITKGLKFEWRTRYVVDIFLAQGVLDSVPFSTLIGGLKSSELYRDAEEVGIHLRLQRTPYQDEKTGYVGKAYDKHLKTVEERSVVL